MQAVHITAHGDPSVLALVDIPTPAPGPGEVLVRVLATSVNHLDLWVRRGMPGMPIPLPRVPGCDGTGEVAALGEGVESVAVLPACWAKDGTASAAMAAARSRVFFMA